MSRPACLTFSRTAAVLVLLPALMGICRPLSAQQLLWDVDFKFGFDNREYASLDISPSETIFGAVLSPKVGLGFGEGHALYAGVDAAKYFGRTSPELSLETLLYYQYDGRYFRVNAGAFPRSRVTGHYPAAFYDDRYFFDTNIGGALLSYTRRWWRIEGVVDWVGCHDRNTRERFEVYSYGQAGASWLSFAYTFKMMHYAGSATVGGVVDNVWVYPHLVSDLTEYLPGRMSLSLRVGWIQTFQNDRIRNEGYVTPGGFQAEAGFEYFGFGVHNTVYAGDNLMPLYYRTGLSDVTYGSDLYTGSLFYSTDSGIYNRLEISYRYDFKDFLSLKAASVHHFDGHGWGWQQLVQLTVNLNNFQFPVRPRADRTPGASRPHHHR